MVGPKGFAEFPPTHHAAIFLIAQVYDICRLIPRGKVTTYGEAFVTLVMSSDRPD